jgi:glyoxylase-like metal-dependent hydrolase (beta-lactamase superfamily II)
MNFKILSVGPFEVNCVVVWNDQKQALVVDPGSDAPDIEDVLREHNLRVVGYLLTHGHADHISALDALYTSHPAPVLIHPADLDWCFGASNQIAPHYAVPKKPNADFSNDWKLDGFEFQTLETPGHTPGGVCYWFKEDGICLTGDTLFKGTCGRTDLPNGDARVLAKSLKTLAALPDDVVVYAGHGEQTTIGHEKRTNFFMQQAAK